MDLYQTNIGTGFLGIFEEHFSTSFIKKLVLFESVEEYFLRGWNYTYKIIDINILVAF